jgi:tetratricopeptide (TPR) repeat protein
MNAGFMNQADSCLREALKLDGDTVHYFADQVWIEFSRENFAEALKLTKRAFSIDTTYLSDFIICSIPPVSKEDAYNDALRMSREMGKSGRFRQQNTYRVGYAFWRMGKYKEADSCFNRQIKYSEEGIRFNRDIGQRKVAQYDLAATYAFLGDKTKAFKYLDEYSELGYFRPAEISLTKNDPFFTGISDEERFKQVVKKMETAYQAEHERVKRWLEKQGLPVN